MKTNKTISVVISAILCSGILFTGCGGGSNSTNNNSSDTGNGNSSLFSPNAIKAEPTIANGKRVKEVVLSVPNVGIDSTFIYNDFFNLSNGEHTQNCPQGGTLSLTLNKNENSVNMAINANNCNWGDVIMNGKINIIARNFDNSANKYKNYITEYSTDFIATYNSYELKIFANSYIERNVNFENGNWKDYNLSISLRATNGNKYVGLQNCKFYFTKDGNLEKFYQTKGKIYIDQDLYVEYDENYDMSQTPFEFSNSTLINGEARYTMSNNSKMKIVVESNEAKVYIDSNNDGEFELSEE